MEDEKLRTKRNINIYDEITKCRFSKEETELNHYLIKNTDITPTERNALVLFFGSYEEFENLDDTITDYKIGSGELDTIYSMLADQIMLYKNRLEKEQPK